MMSNTTAWSEIVVKAKLLIDDIRWQEELATSPARFFRAKSDYVLMALPLLSRPPSLLHYLQSGMTMPSYGSASWQSTEQSKTEQAVVPTGLIGYQMVSVTLRSFDGLDEVPYTDYSYNAETGEVTFGLQSEAGLAYEIDAYSDGEFPALDPTMMRLFALAVAVVWDERFERNWLNMQMKIKDSSFSTAAEGQYLEKVGQRLSRNRAMFNDELRHYEQNVYYANTVPEFRRPSNLDPGA